MTRPDGTWPTSQERSAEERQAYNRRMMDFGWRIAHQAAIAPHYRDGMKLAARALNQTRVHNAGLDAARTGAFVALAAAFGTTVEVVRQDIENFVEEGEGNAD